MLKYSAAAVKIVRTERLIETMLKTKADLLILSSFHKGAVYERPFLTKSINLPKKYNYVISLRQKRAFFYKLLKLSRKISENSFQLLLVFGRKYLLFADAVDYIRVAVRNMFKQLLLEIADLLNGNVL